jgi:ribonuclease E
MPDKMLIDAAHPEETRVVVLRGNRVEEFDFESANRKQLRGNIYLAKVTRVEPSLQAAFIDYGGNRHGFLAFSEIHPDYYQIPVADRQALIAEEARQQREADDDADHRARGGRGRRHRGRGHRQRDEVRRSEPLAEGTTASPAGEQPPLETAATSGDNASDNASDMPEAGQPSTQFNDQFGDQFNAQAAAAEANEPPADEAAGEHAPETAGDAAPEATNEATIEASAHELGDAATEAAPADAPQGEPGNGHAEAGNGEEHHEEEAVESVGGADALEEVQERVPRFRRQYKIQEVIKRRQVMLVQVVKEERGTKGAALTTYLSLAGRYSVLMPNTARGGGISRKITSAEDRNRLKEISQELEVPEGMGVILRTAGASRTKLEVKRDFEYLLRLWETVRDLTLKSTAPKLVYEEGSLVKRSIRDLYNKDIDEIIVAGDGGYGEARDFMRMLMPSHVKHVKLYKDTQPLFTRWGIESQLDAMFSPVVQLRSGGYIVINQAEALVAIDVNSGRATREHHIEDTALKTNGEAAEEIARQLRLRDLAGLIVIDFIDMDETRNNRTVERRMKDALKNDRARIQVGRISHFGLLEMSRQRIRSSVLESSTEKCPICGGSGHVRSVSSVALQLLRALEEMLIKGATHNLIVRTRSEVALYVLNHKRGHLRALEERFQVTLTITADATVTGQVSYIIDRGELVHSVEAAKALADAARRQMPIDDVVEDEDAQIAEESAEAEIEAAEHHPPASHEPAHEPAHEGAAREGGPEGDRDGSHRRRRRRGRGGRGRGGEPREPREGGPQQFTHDTVPEHAVAHEDHDAGASEDDIGGEQGERPPAQAGGENGDRDGRHRRRRGRRGGRRNRRRGNGNGEAPFAGERPEHELHVGADFPPVSDEDASAVSPPFDERPAERAAEAQSAPPPRAEVPEHAAQETPREAPREAPKRRSTTREPASSRDSGSSGPSGPSPTLPPPQPVISSTAAEESGTPKRGWWGKRLLGDKS